MKIICASDFILVEFASDEFEATNLRLHLTLLIA